MGGRARLKPVSSSQQNASRLCPVNDYFFQQVCLQTDIRSILNVKQTTVPTAPCLNFTFHGKVGAATHSTISSLFTRKNVLLGKTYFFSLSLHATLILRQASYSWTFVAQLLVCTSCKTSRPRYISKCCEPVRGFGRKSSGKVPRARSNSRTCKFSSDRQKQQRPAAFTVKTSHL